MTEKKIIYDVDYFINKFKVIPHSAWEMEDLVNDITGACCVLGHCQVREYDDTKHEQEITVFGPNHNWVMTEEADALVDLFTSLKKFIFPNIRASDIDTVYYINDDVDDKYGFGKTPRTRILNALKKVKKLQNV